MSDPTSEELAAAEDPMRIVVAAAYGGVPSKNRCTCPVVRAIGAQDHLPGCPEKLIAVMYLEPERSVCAVCDREIVERDGVWKHVSPADHYAEAVSKDQVRLPGLHPHDAEILRKSDGKPWSIETAPKFQLDEAGMVQRAKPEAQVAQCAICGAAIALVAKEWMHTGPPLMSAQGKPRHVAMPEFGTVSEKLKVTDRSPSPVVFKAHEDGTHHGKLPDVSAHELEMLRRQGDKPAKLTDCSTGPERAKDWHGVNATGWANEFIRDITAFHEKNQQATSIILDQKFVEDWFFAAMQAMHDHTDGIIRKKLDALAADNWMLMEAAEGTVSASTLIVSHILAIMLWGTLLVLQSRGYFG